MRLTDEQWAALEELCSDIARCAAEGDPQPWHDSLLHGDGIQTQLAAILELEETIGTKKIVSRTSPREDVARMWANAASRLGWRVVAVFENGGWLRVWAEAPADVNDREVWDGAMPKVGP